PVGAAAPAFRLPDLDGVTLTLDLLRTPRKPVVLLFTDPDCGPSNALLPEIGRWQRDHADRLMLVAISRGTPAANRPSLSEHGLRRVLLQPGFEVAHAYRAHGTPSAVLVDPDGTIGSPVALGADAIRDLVARALGPATPTTRLHVGPPAATANGANGHRPAPAAPAAPGVLRPGDPAPALRLPDLDGRPIDLKELRGQPTLVLFWNPTCGVCERMLPELRAWEADPPEGAPRLLVVSTGTAEANRRAGLRSPILLDSQLGAGRAFGATGTP